MKSWQLNTPIVFIVFNRPDTTCRVFEAIRQAKPPRLFVVADGPRPNRSGEAEKCAAVRAIVEQVDWPCEVLKNYADINLGCKQRVSSGLDWAFNTVEEAIILEDDCVPHSTFFRFCEELLEKYRDDERIMHISGDNFQLGRQRTEYSYCFSHYSHIWGWASWRRAWQYYDVTMKNWPEINQMGWLEDIFLDRTSVKYWNRIFQLVYDGKIDTWDYQWIYCCLIQRGLTILPNVNLISNIGFGQYATHTVGHNPLLVNIPVQDMVFPLKHPEFVIRDAKADTFTQKNIVSLSYRRRVKNRLKSTVKKLGFY